MNEYRVRLTFTCEVEASNHDEALEFACDDVRTPHELVDWDISKIRDGVES